MSKNCFSFYIFGGLLMAAPGLVYPQRVKPTVPIVISTPGPAETLPLAPKLLAPAHVFKLSQVRMAAPDPASTAHVSLPRPGIPPTPLASAQSPPDSPKNEPPQSNSAPALSQAKQGQNLSGQTVFDGAASPSATDDPISSFVDTLRQRDRDIVEKMASSEQFKRYLRDQGVESFGGLAELERNRILRGYLERYFLTVQGPALEERQDAALEKALLAHGAANPKAIPGRKLLEEISGRNIDKLLSLEAKSFAPGPELETARRIVEDMEFYFSHFSHQSHSLTRTPILSSKQLTELVGIPFGLNTKSFNRHLGSDDNVFFFPIFEPKRAGSIAPGRSEYGGHSIVPKAEYLETKGWISFFVMYPEQLYSFARLRLPELAAKLEEPKHEMLSGIRVADNYVSAKLGPVVWSLMEEIRGQLHVLDFTVGDFKTLVKKQLLFELDKLRINNPPRYEQSLKDLQDNRKTVNKVIADLVFHALDIGPYASMGIFEGKIPVALPAGQYHPIESKFE